MTKNIAIIPARGGSKRIPKKNIKIFCGKPIIAWSIEAALNSGLFDEVMVSTDSEEIAEIAIKQGAKVPFLRSMENASDKPGFDAVIKEVLDDYKKLGSVFDNLCFILATAPFTMPENLKEGYKIFLSGNFKTVMTVSKFSYPIQRALSIDNSKLSMVLPDNLRKRSQELESRYHDAGQFYFMQIDDKLENATLFTDNSGAIVLPESMVQDIDTYEDWKIAELKFTLMRQGVLDAQQ